MSVFHKVYQIADKTWLIDELESQSIYLLIGSKYALLIDTGIGIGDLKGVINSITTLPLIVVMTHGHLDHAGAAGQFKEIYVHPADADMINELSLDHRKSYVSALLDSFIESGKDFGSIDPSIVNDIERWKFKPALRDLSDGYEFDLGERKVSIMETPGHTYGSVVLFDDKTGSLFSGDACNHNLLLDLPLEYSKLKTPDLNFASVDTCLNSLLKIKEHDNFLNNYTGHLCEIDNKPASLDILNDCIACCRGILDGTVLKRETYMKSQKQALYGSVMITYNENRLKDKKFSPGEF
jgi:hydroxyacylglutathione hydrolase